MNFQEAIDRMVAPGTLRPTKWRQGVIQILVTASCDKACFNCTQHSQLRQRPWFMTPEQFEQACNSLRGYFGVVGVMGGNPAISPHFEAYCDILCKHFPLEQRGLWCNNPLGKGHIMRRTYDPKVSNLNCHLDMDAYKEFKDTWPESLPFGHTEDSRHSPVLVSPKDIGILESEMWELISGCDINRLWSAAVSIFRGELRAYFCEVAASISRVHQDDPRYPDTGLPVEEGWWRKPMQHFAEQVNQQCTSCGVALRGYGEMALNPNGIEQVSATHANIAKPKVKDRQVQIVTTPEQLGATLRSAIDYMGNARKPKEVTTVR